MEKTERLRKVLRFLCYLLLIMAPAIEFVGFIVDSIGMWSISVMIYYIVILLGVRANELKPTQYIGRHN